MPRTLNNNTRGAHLAPHEALAEQLDPSHVVIVVVSAKDAGHVKIEVLTCLHGARSIGRVDHQHRVRLSILNEVRVVVLPHGNYMHGKHPMIH